MPIYGFCRRRRGDRRADDTRHVDGPGEGRVRRDRESGVVLPLGWGRHLIHGLIKVIGRHSS
jgi:hypothetical protein